MRASSVELESLIEVSRLYVDDRAKSASVSDPSIPELDREFHVGIARASGNRVLSACVSALHHATEPVHYLDLSPEVGRVMTRRCRRYAVFLGRVAARHRHVLRTCQRTER